VYEGSYPKKCIAETFLVQAAELCRTTAASEDFGLEGVISQPRLVDLAQLEKIAVSSALKPGDTS
jgi:hypothetical protein